MRRLYDDFDSRAERIASKDSPSKARHVYTFTPRTGPWSGDPRLGQTQPYTDNSVERQSVIKTDEMGPPRVHTVSLWLDFDSSNNLPGGSLPNFAFAADCIAGIGGTSHQFLVDWHNGTAFSLPCSSLEIVAVYSPAFGIISPNLPANLRLSAMVGVGGDLQHQPTYTVLDNDTSIAAGSNGDPVIIPKFSRRVFLDGYVPVSSLTPDPIANTPEIFIDFCTDFAASQIIVIRNFTLQDYVNGIPIPNGVKSMRVGVRAGGSAYQNARYVFQLDL